MSKPITQTPFLLWWSAINAWLISINLPEITFGPARRFYEAQMLPGDILRKLVSER